MIYATEQQVVVTSGIVIIVALFALFTGIWWGHGRALEEAAEEAQWEREQAAARRDAARARRAEAADEARLAHEEQALAVANDGETLGEEWDRIHPGWREQTVLAPTAVLSPADMSVTEWTTAMAADMDQFIADMISGTDKQLKEITR